MKNILKIFSAIAIFSTLLWSCSDDDTYPRIGTMALDDVVINVVTPTTITDVVLDPAKKEEVWQTFTFESNADLATVFAPSTITYKVVVDKSGDNFDSPYTVASSTTSPIAVKVKDLNTALVAMGYEKGEIANIDIKVIAQIGAGSSSVSSATISTFNATNYGEIVIPPLYIVGSHNGWDPKTAPQMRVVMDATTGNVSYYEAYLNTADNFKFISNQADWSGVTTQYAPGSDLNLTNTGTTFDSYTFAGSGGAYKVASAGLYYIRVNAAMTTMKIVKMNWGLIGDAVPVSGWGSESPMTYDAATQTFTYTGELKAGAAKFRCKNAGDLVWIGEWKYNTGKEKSPVYKDAEGGGGDANFDVTAQASATVTLKVAIDGKVTVTGL